MPLMFTSHLEKFLPLACTFEQHARTWAMLATASHGVHPFVPDVLHFTEHQRRSEAGPSSRESQASTCVSERYPVLGIQVAVSSPPHCGLRALMSSLRSFRHTLLCKPQEKLYVSYVRKPPTKITDHFISLQCSPVGKAKYNKDSHWPVFIADGCASRACMICLSKQQPQFLTMSSPGIDASHDPQVGQPTSPPLTNYSVCYTRSAAYESSGEIRAIRAVMCRQTRR